MRDILLVLFECMYVDVFVCSLYDAYAPYVKESDREAMMLVLQVGLLTNECSMQVLVFHRS